MRKTNLVQVIQNECSRNGCMPDQSVIDTYSPLLESMEMFMQKAQRIYALVKNSHERFARLLGVSEELEGTLDEQLPHLCRRPAYNVHILGERIRIIRSWIGLGGNDDDDDRPDKPGSPPAPAPLTSKAPPILVS